MLKPLGRRLRANLFDTRHVVNHIAHQGLIVHHQTRRHAKLGLHTGQVAALAVHGVDHGDVLRHQLRKVFVATGDHHINALRVGGRSQGADHIISLHAGHHQHLPAQQAHDLVDRLDLRAQVVRHRGTLRLVFIVNLVAKGGAFGIKHAGGELGVHFFAQAGQHVDHDTDGPGFLFRAVGQFDAHAVATGEKGAVQVAGAVDQQQGLGGGRIGGDMGIGHLRILHLIGWPTLALQSAGCALLLSPLPSHSA